MDWPAIIAGAVLATAISFVLITFGSAIGLSMSSAEPGSGVSLSWLAIVAGLWLLWVQISSFLAGGYLTGRLRRRHGDATEHELDIRDGSHGLVMWALGLLVGAMIAFWASAARSRPSPAPRALPARVSEPLPDRSSPNSTRTSCSSTARCGRAPTPPDRWARKRAAKSAAS